MISYILVSGKTPKRYWHENCINMVEITSYLDNFHVVNLKNNAPYGNPVKNINRKSQMESDVHDRWWRSTEDLIFQLILWEAVDGKKLCGGPQPIFDNLLTEDTNILKEYLAIVMDVRKYWKDETMEVQLRPDYRVLSLLYLYTI